MSETKIKVLMAEDEPDVLSVMSKAIARHGYDVISASNGNEAWEKFSRKTLM